MGHETNTFSTRFSLKMVSTRSKAGVNKQADAGPSGPAGITPDLAAILDGDEGLTPTKDGGKCLRRLSMFRKEVH